MSLQFGHSATTHLSNPSPSNLSLRLPWDIAGSSEGFKACETTDWSKTSKFQLQRDEPGSRSCRLPLTHRTSPPPHTSGYRMMPHWPHAQLTPVRRQAPVASAQRPAAQGWVQRSSHLRSAHEAASMTSMKLPPAIVTSSSLPGSAGARGGQQSPEGVHTVSHYVKRNLVETDPMSRPKIRAAKGSETTRLETHGKAHAISRELPQSRDRFPPPTVLYGNPPKLLQNTAAPSTTAPHSPIGRLQYLHHPINSKAPPNIPPPPGPPRAHVPRFRPLNLDCPAFLVASAGGSGGGSIATSRTPPPSAKENHGNDYTPLSGRRLPSSRLPELSCYRMPRTAGEGRSDRKTAADLRTPGRDGKRSELATSNEVPWDEMNVALTPSSLAGFKAPLCHTSVDKEPITPSTKSTSSNRVAPPSIGYLGPCAKTPSSSTSESPIIGDWKVEEVLIAAPPKPLLTPRPSKASLQYLISTKEQQQPPPPIEPPSLLLTRGPERRRSIGRWLRPSASKHIFSSTPHHHQHQHQQAPSPSSHETPPPPLPPPLGRLEKTSVSVSPTKPVMIRMPPSTARPSVSTRTHPTIEAGSGTRAITVEKQQRLSDAAVSTPLPPNPTRKSQLPPHHQQPPQQQQIRQGNTKPQQLRGSGGAMKETGRKRRTQNSETSPKPDPIMAETQRETSQNRPQDVKKRTPSELHTTRTRPSPLAAVVAVALEDKQQKTIENTAPPLPPPRHHHNHHHHRHHHHHHLSPVLVTDEMANVKDDFTPIEGDFTPIEDEPKTSLVNGNFSRPPFLVPPLKIHPDSGMGDSQPDTTLTTRLPFAPTSVGYHQFREQGGFDPLCVMVPPSPDDRTLRRDAVSLSLASTVKARSPAPHCDWDMQSHGNLYENSDSVQETLGSTLLYAPSLADSDLDNCKDIGQRKRLLRPPNASLLFPRDGSISLASGVCTSTLMRGPDVSSRRSNSNPPHSIGPGTDATQKLRRASDLMGTTVQTWQRDCAMRFPAFAGGSPRTRIFDLDLPCHSGMDAPSLVDSISGSDPASFYSHRLYDFWLHQEAKTHRPTKSHADFCYDMPSIWHRVATSSRSRSLTLDDSSSSVHLLEPDVINLRAPQVQRVSRTRRSVVDVGTRRAYEVVTPAACHVWEETSLTTLRHCLPEAHVETRNKSNDTTLPPDAGTQVTEVVRMPPMVLPPTVQSPHPKWLTVPPRQILALPDASSSIGIEDAVDSDPNGQQHSDPRCYTRNITTVNEDNIPGLCSLRRANELGGMCALFPRYNSVFEEFSMWIVQNESSVENGWRNDWWMTGSFYAAISCSWIKAWLKFVFHDIAISAFSSEGTGSKLEDLMLHVIREIYDRKVPTRTAGCAPRPPKIDNSEINRKQRAKMGFTNDYIFIRPECWDFIHSLYGGGPPIISYFSEGEKVALGKGAPIRFHGTYRNGHPYTGTGVIFDRVTGFGFDGNLRKGSMWNCFGKGRLPDGRIFEGSVRHGRPRGKGQICDCYGNKEVDFGLSGPWA